MPRHDAVSKVQTKQVHIGRAEPAVVHTGERIRWQRPALGA
jgi:hypothetical protein